ncbi:unnamed protein product [Withania somnifera]
MESYSYKIYSSSFSSSSSSFVGHDQHGEKKEKPYLSTLHRVRSVPSKSIIKKPIAPAPPIPPKIYRVEAVYFRQVVQMLTAAPEFQSQFSKSAPGSGSTHLQEVSAPLDLSPTSLSSNINIGGRWREFLPPSSTVVIPTDEASYYESTSGARERHVNSPIQSGACSPLGFPQSPSSFVGCSSHFLSPDTLTSMDSSTVL